MMRLTLPALMITLASAAHANTCGASFTVGAGQTYYSIAQRCGVTVDQLFAANPDVDHNDLALGQILALPGPAGAAGVYADDFLGSYGNARKCHDADLRIDLRPASVRFRNFNTADGIDEDWSCPITGVRSDYPSAVTVSLGQCWAEYAALSWEGEVMTFEYAAAYEVQRCTR